MFILHARYSICVKACAALSKRHLEFFQLLKNHVVWHVVKEAVARSQDDVTELHVEGGAVSSFRTRGEVGGQGQDQSQMKPEHAAIFSVELSRSEVTLLNLEGGCSVGVKPDS